MSWRIEERDRATGQVIAVHWRVTTAGMRRCRKACIQRRSLVNVELVPPRHAELAYG